MTQLALLTEHPSWVLPLIGTLERRGIDFVKLHADGHHYDPADPTPPAPLIFNRIAMSSFLRSADHPIFYAQSLFAAWEGAGARVINGAKALLTDASKARQLALIAGLGLGVPKTRVVHRIADMPAAAASLPFPLLVKSNIGGSGAGIARFDSLDQLRSAVADRMIEDSIDKVWLLQDYVPARGGRIIRLEILDGRFLYALSVDGGGGFDLCPADVCLAEAGKPPITIEAVAPDAGLIAASERIMNAAGIDVGGVEALVDDRDGSVLFYDINGFSNFVADPIAVLGWDPHERLVDWIGDQLRQREEAR